MLLGATTTLAQSGTDEPERSLYFPETGHTLTGDFLIYYKDTPNAELVLGNPITEPFEDQFSGHLVQYFERARLEKGDGNELELEVFASPLGYYMYVPSTELYSPKNLPGCRYYSEYKKHVCYAFLDFFEAHGGVAQFGYPISNFEIRDGWIVQYFQRARFEWHPELPSGQRVKLSDLGSLYFDMIKEDPKRLRPPELPVGGPFIQPVLDLRVHASLRNAATHQDGEQTVDIVVLDQRMMAVAGADFTLEITLPSGKTLEPVTPLTTDKNGIAHYTFNFKGQSIGRAIVKVKVNYDGLHAETVNTFQIWW